jgi:hypothetical protein
MNRFARMGILAALAFAIVGVPTAAAAGPANVRIDVAVALSGNLSSSTTRGTFTISGAIADSGTETGSGWFSGQGHLKTGQPNALHGEMTLVGGRGTISIELDGLFGHLPAALAQGEGNWRISGGTGAYADLHGQGSWTATADFRAAIAGMGPPRVTFVDLGEVN